MMHAAQLIFSHTICAGINVRIPPPTSLRRTGMCRRHRLGIPGPRRCPSGFRVSSVTHTSDVVANVPIFDRKSEAPSSQIMR